MESLFNSHDADSCWSIDQELAPTPCSTAYTTPRFRNKTSGYDTGFSTAEFDEEKFHSKKNGRVRKVRSIKNCSYFVAQLSYFKCLLLATAVHT